MQKIEDASKGPPFGLMPCVPPPLLPLSYLIGHMKGCRSDKHWLSGNFPMGLGCANEGLDNRAIPGRGCSSRSALACKIRKRAIRVSEAKLAIRFG